MAKTIAAGIFLVRRDGRLLVCHPTNHKPDFWSIPKGKVEDGESLVVAAIRETFEETNIDVSTCFNIRPLEPQYYSHKKKMIHPFLLMERENDNIDWSTFNIKCNSHVLPERGGFPEMDDFKWVTLEEAKSLVHETQVACLDQISSLVNNI
jgi:8-oxo-dGTP pyrophosphatase MutT (NUDIX family)